MQFEITQIFVSAVIRCKGQKMSDVDVPLVLGLMSRKSPCAHTPSNLLK